MSIEKTNEDIYKYIFIWKNNIKYEILENKIKLLEKRLVWEHIKYTTYRRECDINLIESDYKVCEDCNNYIYPLNIEEWLNIDIKNYDDIIKYEKHGLEEGMRYIGIGTSQQLLSCVCNIEV